MELEILSIMMSMVFPIRVIGGSFDGVLVQIQGFKPKVPGHAPDVEVCPLSSSPECSVMHLMFLIWRSSEVRRPAQSEGYHRPAQ